MKKPGRNNGVVPPDRLSDEDWEQIWIRKFVDPLYYTAPITERRSFLPSTLDGQERTIGNRRSNLGQGAE